jgi:hypothetical protein
VTGFRITVSQNAFLGKRLAFWDGIKEEKSRLRSFVCGRTRTGTEKPPAYAVTGGLERKQDETLENLMPVD